jgi:hypothetical protein
MQTLLHDGLAVYVVALERRDLPLCGRHGVVVPLAGAGHAERRDALLDFSGGAFCMFLSRGSGGLFDCIGGGAAGWRCIVQMDRPSRLSSELQYFSYVVVQHRNSGSTYTNSGRTLRWLDTPAPFERSDLFRVHEAGVVL